MRKHVLLVNDEAATLLGYKKLLEGPGVFIETAETLEEPKNA